MNFARWTEPPNLPGLEDAEEFIVDIPDGTSREDVVANIALDDYSDTITDADKFGFEDEWPREIHRQFAAGEGKRRPWKA
jgi:hypothetical protein